MTISVVILTLNEEINIGACLASVTWSDDVVVLDSGSSDRTLDIAREHGARIHHRPFDDYAAQRNHALQDIDYRHPWLLMLDADERMTPELHADMMTRATAAPPEVCLFMMKRRDHLYGRWIRGSGGYGTRFGRLARLGRVWVERPINEEYCTDGLTAELAHDLDHYPFNKGLSAWLVKHDRYSTMEAQLLHCAPRAPLRLRDVIAADYTARRRALKRLLYRMPGRPLLVFCHLYFARRGFLEGRAGFTFSALRAWYEFQIDCKRLELSRRERGLPV